MIRQYHAPRFIGNDPHKAGPVRAGDYLRLRHYGLLRVDGWIPREYCTFPHNVFMRGGHLAQVTQIGTGLTFKLAEQYLYAAHDECAA